ncbi:MAG: two component transcriptional regulator, AraC family [Clostridia bacterium]|jgi:two-component system response regulator YesN|nr:two component transcriptional regulator, AraC family [Clostridia bacterium]
MSTSNYLTLLIVDDELAIRDGVSKAMPWEDLGIHLIGTCENGFEALDMILIHQPDIVLTDIKMPKCDGLTLIKKAKEQQIACKFIIMSGYSDFSFAKKAIRYGVENYLLKPIKKDELIETFQNIKNKLYGLASSNYIEYSVEKQLQELIHNKHNPKQNISLLSSNLKLTSPISIIIFDSPADFHLLKTALSQFITPPIGFVFEYDTQKLAAIVSVNNIINSKYQSIWALCTHMIQAISASSNAGIYCGIGDSVSELTFIWQSYRTALDYLAYKMYKTSQFIFDQAIVSTEVNCPLTLSSKYSESLIEAILIHDPMAITEITRSFFEWLLYIPMPPPNFVRGMCIHLMIDIQKKLALYDAIREEILQDIPHKAILSCSTLQDIENWLIYSFTHYSSCIHHIKSTTQEDAIELALNYIEQNITSKLTLEDVASHIHLSKSYFTSLFKTKTGESFRNYLLNAKIEYAKKLLQESDITVSNLSYLLGYEEYRSFNRAFKKNTGKTPSEYHKLYAIQKN